MTAYVMRRHDDEMTGTERHALDAFGRPHVAAMWPGGSAVKELLASARVTVGRAKTCDIVIDHPSVSREHAVFYGGDPAEVEDLGSTNGTLVGGAPLGRGARVPVERGQVVGVGAAVIVVRSALPSSKTPAAAALRKRAVSSVEAPQVIVADDSMRELHRIVDLVAKGELSVILLGETGTGKDVIADAIHRRSARAAEPYVRLNCAALPDALLESELFGYERGAFTGAMQAKQGLMEVADGGTLFLDEIGELPLAMQAKLLRVLENREITRVGGLRSRSIDLRIVCATNRDLAALVRSGAFRQDLYFRLNGITLVIPPLRARRAEIVPLARALIVDACRVAGRPPLAFSENALRALEEHPWPGNVRELRNAIDRAVTLCTGEIVDVHHLTPPESVFEDPTPSAPSPPDRATTPFLPSRVASSSAPPAPTTPMPPAPAGMGLYDDARRAAQSLERRRIAEAMERCGGNQTRAAELLQISRRTLVARLTEYGFARPLKGRKGAD
jgi:two-component system response regulator AtoC